MIPIIGLSDVAADTRRGGEVRTLLSPRTVGSTSGFMGVAHLAPGDTVTEHYHPYSEEFVYLVSGALVVEVNGEPHHLTAGQGLVLPVETRHRLRNEGSSEACLVFQLGPLAPRPELGHVDTETAAPPAPAPAESAPAASAGVAAAAASAPAAPTPAPIVATDAAILTRRAAEACSRYPLAPARAPEPTTVGWQAMTMLGRTAWMHFPFIAPGIVDDSARWGWRPPFRRGVTRAGTRPGTQPMGGVA